MRWQHRLFDRLVDGEIPAALDLPTGLGKTSVMAIWLLARAFAKDKALAAIPRRLVYVVDRRAVVDQATEEAEKLREALEGDAKHLKEAVGLASALPISTLRGAHVDNREWLGDPAMPAIIVGTVDMIGSRLLFEGYGVSRKMRPYHAGLLGADVLLVLDEAHLVPPFAGLLRTIESGPSLWPADRAPLPRFVVLPLSATQRERLAGEGGHEPFGLEEEDWHDETASQRLNARKQLRIEPLAEKDHDRQLAEAAISLATQGGSARVVVFCDRREKKDDGAGPSAQGVAEAIAELAEGGKKAGRGKIDIDPPELLVGARRVYEREQAAHRLRELGFTSRAAAPAKPAFLVATSAGEVGVDLDADHMVCDLAPWERMVQRLGRVNRRGGADRKAHVAVFDSSWIEKDEARKALLMAARDLLDRIETDLGGRLDPATLLELRDRVGRGEIEKASTPEPLRPALTRALVDAWSMTSLDRHTGRPEVAPWLRGWVDERPQTTVVWRRYLPLRIEDGRAGFSSRQEINAFFEAAPPDESEKLETETFRVANWLQQRADALLQRKPLKRSTGSAVSEEPAADGAAGAGEAATELQRNDVIVLVLSPSAEYERHLTLGDLAQERKGKAKELNDVLAEKILVVDARFGGLTDGVLNDKGDDGFPTADACGKWSGKAGFRVWLSNHAQEEKDEKEGDAQDWHFEDEFIVRRGDDGDPAEWLVVEHLKSAARSEDARSISRPQELAQHQSCAEQKARRIAVQLGLSGHAAEALALAAFLHDEGKKAPRWQRAFRAPREKDASGAYKIFAKTRGPISQAILDGYRHEFGSLPWAEASDRLKTLPEDWRDLVLHLIAAHHGQARPVIEARGCEDAPPTALEERARAVALRFARLQKRWGPWGLAWWEALLRAADQQASRDNDAPALRVEKS
jgi:CRISPR-associated endonuclease/helicase Cas3